MTEQIPGGAPKQDDGLPDRAGWGPAGIALLTNALFAGAGTLFATTGSVLITVVIGVGATLLAALIVTLYRSRGEATPALRHGAKRILVGLCTRRPPPASGQ